MVAEVVYRLAQDCPWECLFKTAGTQGLGPDTTAEQDKALLLKADGEADSGSCFSLMLSPAPSVDN